MYVQLITFTLNGVTEQEYEAGCHEVAGVFSDLPGLLSKTWLRDPETGTYGGLYLWRDREAYEAYLAGDIFRSIQEDPSLDGVSSRGFDTFDELTRSTQPGLTLA